MNRIVNCLKWTIHNSKASWPNYVTISLTLFSQYAFIHGIRLDVSLPGRVGQIERSPNAWGWSKKLVILAFNLIALKFNCILTTNFPETQFKSWWRLMSVKFGLMRNNGDERSIKGIASIKDEPKLAPQCLYCMWSCLLVNIFLSLPYI